MHFDPEPNLNPKCDNRPCWCGIFIFATLNWIMIWFLLLYLWATIQFQSDTLNHFSVAGIKAYPWLNWRWGRGLKTGLNGKYFNHQRSEASHSLWKTKYTFTLWIGPWLLNDYDPLLLPWMNRYLSLGRPQMMISSVSMQFTDSAKGFVLSPYVIHFDVPLTSRAQKPAKILQHHLQHEGQLLTWQPENLDPQLILPRFGLKMLT